PTEIGFDPEAVDEGLKSPGQPIDEATRRTMESAFGHDFSHVRVHANKHATEASDALRANAYTVGHDVVFGAGKFLPGSPEGRRLLAHELAHVVQQERGTGSVSHYSSAEYEAKYAGECVVAGRTVSVRSTGAGGLQLDEKEDERIARAFLTKKQSTGRSPAQSGADSNAHTSPAKPVDPTADFRHPASKEEIERLRQWSIERQNIEDQQKKAKEEAGRAKEAEDRQRVDVATRAADFKKQHEKAQQAPPLFLSFMGPGFVQSYYRNPSGSIQDPLLRQQADLTTSAVAGHGALGTTAVAVGTGVTAAATLLAVGSLALPVITAITLEAAAGSAVLTPVVTVIIANPLTVTEMAQFGTGVLLAVVAAGGIKNYLEQLATPEGAAQMALDLVVLHGTIKSTSVGSPRPATAKGKIEGASPAGIKVRIVEPLAAANDVAPPKAATRAGASGNLPPTPTNLSSRRSAAGNDAVQRRLQNARVQQGSTAGGPNSEPASQVAAQAAEVNSQRKVAVGQSHSGESTGPSGVANQDRTTDAAAKKSAAGTTPPAQTPAPSTGPRPDSGGVKGVNVPPERPPVEVEARARGGAIERDHLDSMPDVSRPKEHDFPGVDGWTGGRDSTRETNSGRMRIISGANVLQIKSVGTSEPALVRARVREGISGLDANVFERGATRIVNPASRRLDVLFEEGALPSVSADARSLLTSLSAEAGNRGVEIRWFRYSSGRKTRVQIP
ncbi:MAG: DUF4157 domain-containing protein, partial [Opitutus sp.]